MLEPPKNRRGVRPRPDSQQNPATHNTRYTHEQGRGGEGSKGLPRQTFSKVPFFAFFAWAFLHRASAGALIAFAYVCLTVT